MCERDYVVQSAAQCLDVLFALANPEFSFKSEEQISDELSLSRNKVFRSLKTLESRSLVIKVGREWSLDAEFVQFSEGFKRYIEDERKKLKDMEIEYLGK